MRGFNHATILCPSFHSLHKERLAQWPAFCVLNYNQKFWWVLPEKLGGGVWHTSWNPYPISDQICDFRYSISDLIKKLIPYFRPEALEPSTWPEHVTSCNGTYTVVGVNIKREMVLPAKDEEVGYSSKKHTQFKTRVHKPCIVYFRPKWSKLIPYFRPKWLKKHTLWCGTYLYNLYKGLPHGGKKHVADYESRSLHKQD